MWIDFGLHSSLVWTEVPLLYFLRVFCASIRCEYSQALTYSMIGTTILFSVLYFVTHLIPNHHYAFYEMWKAPFTLLLVLDRPAAPY